MLSPGMEIIALSFVFEYFLTNQGKKNSSMAVTGTSIQFDIHDGFNWLQNAYEHTGHFV